MASLINTYWQKKPNSFSFNAGEETSFFTKPRLEHWTFRCWAFSDASHDTDQQRQGITKDQSKLEPCGTVWISKDQQGHDLKAHDCHEGKGSQKEVLLDKSKEDTKSWSINDKGFQTENDNFSHWSRLKFGLSYPLMAKTKKAKNNMVAKFNMKTV